MSANGKPPDPDLVLSRADARRRVAQAAAELEEPGTAERALMRARGSVKARPNEAAAGEVDRVLNGVATDHLDRIQAIYEDVLSLEPDPDWKPGSRLDFRARQLTQLERLLNRVQGMPIQRQRFVNGDDEDIERDIRSLPAPVVERLLIALVTARDGSAGELELDAEDAEVIPDDEGA